MKLFLNRRRLSWSSMIKRTGVILTLLIVTFVIFSAPAWGLSSPNVPISDRVYKDIDHLIAAKLVKPTIVGQRPYARSEIARMIAEAIKNQDKLQNESESRAEYLNETIDTLTDQYRDELIAIGAIEGKAPSIIVHPIETVKFEFDYLKSHEESFIYDNGVGFIDARILPLAQYQEGRKYVYGAQFSIESEHRAQLSKYFSLYARPYFKFYDSADATFQNLYGKFEISNFELEVGRDSLVWGQAEYGSTLISNNARPLDMVKITNPSPTILPSFLKYIGPVRYTLFVGNLGPEYPVRYPYFCGYKLSIMPFHLWELGFSHAVMMGGDGAPKLSVGDIFGEFFGFRPAGTSGTDLNKTNHQMEAETAITIPPLRNTRIYFSINNEDKRDTIWRFLKDGTAYQAGVYIPRLNYTGDADLRLEYYHTSPIHYRHGAVYAAGYTLNRNVIGSALGPNADGVHVEYHQDINHNRKLDLTATFDWERRGSNIYGVTTDPDGTLGDTYIMFHRPYENRFRLALKHRWPVTNELLLESYAGFERIHNKNFVSGNSGNDILIGASLKYNFDKYFKYQSHAKTQAKSEQPTTIEN